MGYPDIYAAVYGARTALIPVFLVWDMGTPDGAGALSDTANGNTVPPPGPCGALIVAVNGDAAAAHSVIVRAAGSGPDAGGNPQTSPYPSSAVYAQGAVGDLAIPVAASSAQTIGPLTTGRFTQPDGSLSLDYSPGTGTSLTVYVLVLPR